MNEFALNAKEDRFVRAVRSLVSDRIAKMCEEMLTSGQTLDAVMDELTRAAQVVGIFDDE